MVGWWWGVGRWCQTKIKDHLYPAKAGSGADLDTFPTFPAGWVVGWVGGWVVWWLGGVRLRLKTISTQLKLDLVLI